MPQAIASSLGVSDWPGHAVLDAVVRDLAKRVLLVVLDNCEHLLAPAAGAVDVLLREAPGLRVLATSREPLGVEGEQCVRVASLAVAAAEARVEDVMRSDAVRLFAARATAATPAFAAAWDAGRNLPFVEAVAIALG